METTRTPALDTVVIENTNQRFTLRERLFLKILKRIEVGSLLVVFPNGQQVVVGDGQTLPHRFEIVDAAFFGRVIAGGSVGFGEAYVDGLWTTDSLTEVLKVFAANERQLGAANRGFSIIAKAANRLYHLARRNTLKRSRENIQEHYDLSNDFYQCFLDPTMTYSSAKFETYYESLEQAQLRKIDRMLDLANVRPGDSILEIGSGWGALAMRAAERGAHVKTITLSDEQFVYAQEKIVDAGFASQVDIQIQDYRTLEGKFDAVVSCEMIEAVGKEYLPSYFATIRRSLKAGGRAVIQAITIPDERYDAYSKRCDWIQKHIFPGGHLPSPGAIREHVHSAGRMRVEAMESFGPDYAETLNRWASAFNANRQQVESLGFDARFCRKWNYYLSYCEAGFDTSLIDVQHVVLQRDAV